MDLGFGTKKKSPTKVAAFDKNWILRALFSHQRCRLWCSKMTTTTLTMLSCNARAASSALASSSSSRRRHLSGGGGPLFSSFFAMRTKSCFPLHALQVVDDFKDERRGGGGRRRGDATTGRATPPKKRDDSDYEDEINKLSIGDVEEIFASAAAKENSEDIEDVLKRELRLRAKIDEAEQKLEDGREKLNEMAEKKKEELDREMNLLQNKNSLEFGVIANDLDAELKKMAEESEVAKKRNEAMKQELERLAEELARGTSRASRREKGVNAIDVDRKKEKEVNPLTKKMADEEAMNTDEKMKKTLAETQRGTTFFLLKLLLGIIVIFELAKGEFAVSSALAAALALVLYQSEAEKANEGNSE